MVGCVLAAGLWVSWVAAADEPLTWDACVKEALEHNPDLAAKREAVKQAEAGVTTARSPLLPQLGANIGADRRWRDLGTEITSTTTSNSFHYGLSLQQMLFDGFKSWRVLDQAEINRLAAHWDYDDTSAAVRRNLRAAFVELLRSQSLRDLTQVILTRRQKNIELVQLRYDAGREHRGSLLLAKAQLAQAEADARQADRDVVQAQYSLNRELGRATFTPTRAAGELALSLTVPTQPDFAELVRQHPRWKSLHEATESARLGVEISRSSWYPTISADASTGKSGGTWPVETASSSASLSLNWSLFKGGQRIGENARAEAVYKQAQALEWAGQADLTVNLVKAWSSFSRYADTVEVQHQFLIAAEERSRISESQYTTGLIGFDNWIIIEDDLVQARKSYLNAQSQSLVSEADWIRAEGGTLDHEK